MGGNQLFSFMYLMKTSNKWNFGVHYGLNNFFFMQADTLVDHIKFDHGYTAKSPAIVNVCFFPSKEPISTRVYDQCLLCSYCFLFVFDVFSY